MCVMVRFCVEAIYTPPPPSHSWREPWKRVYTSSIHFLRENHLLMCLDQDIPIQPQYSWSLAFPKFSFHSNHIFERELSVGKTIIWSTRASSSSSSHHLLPFGEWCLLNWLGVTWELPSKLWSWTKEFVRARRSPTSWRSTLVRQVLRGRWPWWDRQGCFFVDPSWVEPFVDSCNRYPSWVEVSINMDVR